MVLIKKDKIELTVSRGAYEGFYRRCGFELVSATEAHEYTPTQEKVHPKNSPHIADESVREDEYEDEIDLSEIPLAEMTYSQLCDYADQMGLDRDGIKSAKGLRALIKANR